MWCSAAEDASVDPPSQIDMMLSATLREQVPVNDDVRGWELSFEGWKHMPKSIYRDSIGDKMTIAGGPEIKTKHSGKPAEVMHVQHSS